MTKGLTPVLAKNGILKALRAEYAPKGIAISTELKQGCIYVNVDDAPFDVVPRHSVTLYRGDNSGLFSYRLGDETQQASILVEEIRQRVPKIIDALRAQHGPVQKGFRTIVLVSGDAVKAQVARMRREAAETDEQIPAA